MTVRTPTTAQASRAAPGIALWLFICAAMVFAMVILGGLTRLSHAGLSVVEWRPLSGALPPASDEEWGLLFRDYQQIPEYQAIHRGMTLSEFKSIFWLEYAHRLWGRLIGVVVLVPLAVLWLRRSIDRALGWRLTGVLALGALQGGAGWFMVSSGLADRPDVSQYRLVLHLALAVAIYGLLVRFAFGALRPSGPQPPGAPARGLGAAMVAVLVLVVLTMLSGGFVAGLDAGFAYNTFPLMDGRIVPEDYLALDPSWRNPFENMAAAQFNHRALGLATLGTSALLWASARRRAREPLTRRAADAVLLAALGQAALGVLTLVLVVPLPLALAHQAGAFALLTAALWLGHARNLAAHR